MAEPKEVNSPVNSRNTASKLSGNIAGSSPGAFSNPSRGGRDDSVPAQSPHGGISRNAVEPGELKIHGPED